MLNDVERRRYRVLRLGSATITSIANAVQACLCKGRIIGVTKSAVVIENPSDEDLVKLKDAALICVEDLRIQPEPS